MKRRNSHMSMVLVFGIMALFTMGARPEKLWVCHKSKGKTYLIKEPEDATYKRIAVPKHALKGHEAHGDYRWEEEGFSGHCQDGIDNDCNGVVDMDEPVCPYSVCEAACYSDWVDCDDICWYDLFAEVCQGPGSDSGCNNIFINTCDPACLQQVYECEAACDADYDSCVSQCPAAP